MIYLSTACWRHHCTRLGNTILLKLNEGKSIFCLPGSKEEQACRRLLSATFCQVLVCPAEHRPSSICSKFHQIPGSSVRQLSWISKENLYLGCKMINCAKKFQFCYRVAIPECNIGSVTYGSGWFGHREINSVKNKLIASEPSTCCWFQSIWNLLLSDSEDVAALAVTCHPASRKSLLPLHAEGKFEGRHPDRRTDRETAGSPALWSWNNRHLLTGMLHCSDTTKRALTHRDARTDVQLGQTARYAFRKYVLHNKERIYEVLVGAFTPNTLSPWHKYIFFLIVSVACAGPE